MYPMDFMHDFVPIG